MSPSPWRIWPGIAGLAAIAVLIGGAFAGLIGEGISDWSGALAAFDAYLLRVARFTLWQAVLSTILSVVPAMAIARALAIHRQFPGRGLILRLFAVPLALPAIVVALGVLALYGRAGYFADIFAVLSSEGWPGIYGLSGILVAHVFFNMPLAARLFLHALETVPTDRWRLAAQLGMNAPTRFRLIEWPAMRAFLPAIAGLVFMLCITSFTIVLTLGGGPRATTLEVAIYQALRFDFDPARAVALTMFQIALTVIMLALLARLGANMTGEANLSVTRRMPPLAGDMERGVNLLVIGLALLFVAGPMGAILVAGLNADLARLVADPAVQRAAMTSLVLASLAATLCVLLTFSLVTARRALEMRRSSAQPSLLEYAMDQGAGFVLVVPPIVIGAGWFILLLHGGNVFAAAPFMVVTVNAVMAMPFAMRAVRPVHDAASHRHEKLCASLGITGFARLRLIDWPVLRGPAMTAFSFAMALSLGDLGVIALFGSDQVQTLPYLLLGRMGAYRTADAAGIALLLGLLCLVLMMLADRRVSKMRSD